MPERRKRSSDRRARLDDLIAGGAVRRASDLPVDPAPRTPENELPEGVAAPSHVDLAASTPARILTSDGPGWCLVAAVRLADWSPGLANVAVDYLSVMRGARERFDELNASAGLCLAANSPPDAVLVVDPVVVDRPEPHCGAIGVAGVADDGKDVEFVHYIARDPDEERVVLAALAPHYAACRVAATFAPRNRALGFVRKRAEACGVPLKPGPEAPRRDGPAHLDLRAEAKRRWRDTLGGCSLRRLAGMFCRPDDEAASSGPFPPDVAAGWIERGRFRLTTMLAVLTALLSGIDPTD